MGERPDATAPDTSSKLVRWRQSEVPRQTDEDGVSARNIQTALHDIGRQKDVRLAFDEAHHAVVDFVDGQPSVQAGDAEIGHYRLQARPHRLQIPNARTD